MDWLRLIILILGGLSIFLFGMSVMIDALKSAAGHHMKTFLQAMTKNRWSALLAGTGITAIIQSSSVTTVLAVGFVSAGLLSFQSTLGLILGANLGTTITAQIIAFKITNAAFVMVAFGYLVSVIFPKKSLKDFGSIILGLGLVFLGMNIMGEATHPLKSYEPFLQLMEGLDNHLLGILIGLIFTAAVQSSSATTGVVIVIASQGLVSTDAGIAIILGANIGTCVTAVLSALGKPRPAMRVALSHVLFNVLGVVIWYAFINDLARLVQVISFDDKARQIANAHTLFNVGNTLVFIWFVNPLSRLVMYVLPDLKLAPRELFPELHSYYLDSSSMALDLAKKSIFKLGEYLLSIVERGDKIALGGNERELEKLRKQDDIIDHGQAEILQFLRQIQSLELSEKETIQLESLIEAANILESTSDLITTGLVEASEHRIEYDFKPSAVTSEKLTELYTTAVQSFREALVNFNNDAVESELMVSKEEFKERLISVRSHLMHRLAENDELRITIFRFEAEMLEVIRRLHGLARRLNRKAG